ncbi:MAG: hypothetical protein KA941_13885 [Flavobacteriales bacterium]|nr:hypothetical protein [Flavobacteriales bacterium]
MRPTLSVLLLAIPFVAASQDEGFRCLANNPAELEKHLAATPGAWEHALQAKATLDDHTATFHRGGGDPLIIPVVFHIIHDNGDENISDAQVNDAIRILNEDFNKQNPDWVNVQPAFLDLVGDMGIEFRLALKDPDGNCTNGITRTESTRTYDGDFEMTQLIQWPRERYMNVWVAASANGAAGYTYYPTWLDNWPEADGIVILHSYTGSIGTSAPYKSRVLSHEVGHWLNLKHCWGDSNEPGLPENCNMDDEVEDTPNTSGWTSCTLSGATCGNVQDNVQNYMEYSYCCKMFTHRQGERMLAALTSPIAQRENLWQPENLAITGVLEAPQLCSARFGASRREVCAGIPVIYTDQSYFGVTQRFWSFPGGTPSGSFEETASVVYEQAGIYPVTLNVGDGSTTISTTEEQYITVLPNPGTATPFVEGFENSTALPNDRWWSEDPDADGSFEQTNLAAYTGSNSVVFQNGWQNTGRTDRLVSSTFDLSDASDINISFRYAYAQRNANNDDVLRVYVSGNCGDQWILRKVMHANTSLLTGGIVGGDFIPLSTAQWGEVLMTNINENLHTPSFRIMFEFESGGGNNLYLDDINILGSPVGIGEANAPHGTLHVWPDASGVFAQVEFQTDLTALVVLDLVDPLGRTLTTIANGTYPAGSHRLEIPIQSLAPGLYFLRQRIATQQRVVRFVVE